MSGWSKQDDLEVRNLRMLIRRMKLDGFTGEEGLALARSWEWLADLQPRFDQPPPAPSPAPTPEKVE